MATLLIKRTIDKAMSYIANQKELWNTTREVKDKSWRDVYCPDGVIAYGLRRVERGGVIRFGNTRWQDDALKPFEGFIVGVHMGDVYCTYIDIFWPVYPGGELMMRVTSHPI